MCTTPRCWWTSGGSVAAHSQLSLRVPEPHQRMRDRLHVVVPDCSARSDAPADSRPVRWRGTAVPSGVRWPCPCPSGRPYGPHAAQARARRAAKVGAAGSLGRPTSSTSRMVSPDVGADARTGARVDDAAGLVLPEPWADLRMLSAGALVRRLPTACPPPWSTFEPNPRGGTEPRLPSRPVRHGRSGLASGRKSSVRQPGRQRVPPRKPRGHGPSRPAANVPRSGRSTPQPSRPERSDSRPRDRNRGRRPGLPARRQDDGSLADPLPRPSRLYRVAPVASWSPFERRTVTRADPS